ncbi:MAG: hypothetical protein ACODAQ_12865 [Phycisphaeraceae bacterium]
MAKRWEAEACDLGFDPQSGAAIRRLTSTLMHNTNIYYEEPFGSPDGQRVAYLRSASCDPRHPPNQQLCVANLEIGKITLVDDELECNWIATCAWSGRVMYRRRNNELICLDIATLKKRIVLDDWPLPVEAHLWTMTPDERYLLSGLFDREYHFNLIRVDLENDGKCEVIFRHPDMHGHVQVNHVTGRDVLLQHNRGIRQNQFKHRHKEPTEHAGATHLVIDIDGGNARPINIGEPHTGQSTGHASWMADTGWIATPVHVAGVTMDNVRDMDHLLHDARHPEGNLIMAAPDQPPRAFAAPEHLFNHSSMSRCGRYFVADSFRNGVPGAIEIVIGNIETGKYRTLVSDCGAQGGGPACSHPHPYLTADNRRVIYNADPHHVCHLHVATLPDDFLASLN